MYECRLRRTHLFNAFRKTVHDMTGRVFNKPIVLQDDVPERLKGYAENIDLAGRDLFNFARAVFEDGMQAGISFILTEMPPKPEGTPTLAQDKAEGRRPYLVHIVAENLIGLKSTLIAGQETLTQIRIREWVKEPDPGFPWEDVLIEQVRVIEQTEWRTYRRNKERPNEWIENANGPMTLGVIPLAPVYLNRTGFMMGEPPLEDLADLNVTHWQSSSDQRNILHVARVPILFGAGLDVNEQGQTQVVISANMMAKASNPDAKLSYVEHTGKAIGSGSEDLKQLEFQMQTMGLQLLVPKPGQTATGEIRDDAKEHSTLAMMADGLKDGLERAFGFMAMYENLGADAGGSLVINKDFGLASADAVEVQAILSAASQGLISQETALKELIRRNVLADDLDIDEELRKTALELEQEQNALNDTAGGGFNGQ